MGCSMREIMYLLCVFAVTVYLAVAAWEDHKSCEVTRWKHLIGGIPSVMLFVMNMGRFSLEENAMILAFAGIYVVIGYVGLYGFADGLVLSILSLFFGSIGGCAGGGAVLLIAVISAFSFMIFHAAKCLWKHRKIFQNMSGPLIPHIFVGYTAVIAVMIAYVL